MNTDAIFETEDPDIYLIKTTAPGPSGSLPFTAEFLADRPSGNVFAWTHNTGMGWSPKALGNPEFLILSTQGGIRQPDGKPTALGFHTGHWEVGLLMEEAAREITACGGIPFAGFCSDPCDGRSMGTLGMLDSLAYRNDAAVIFRRLIRSLPTRHGVMGIATCDKGLPAMMMALAGCPDLPSLLVPGGVTLLSEEGENMAKVQTIGARFVHGDISLQQAAEAGCRSCGSPGGGCQFLGTAGTSQVVSEGLGMTLPHAALMPSGSNIWKDTARRSARSLMELAKAGRCMGHILSQGSIENALAVHAAFGGSTNLVMHLPAIAHAAGLAQPDVNDWQRVNREVPRIVDVLPNGPHGFATVQVFLAGGVPEVMLHLRALDRLDLDAATVTGNSVGQHLNWWETSERRRRLRDKLHQLDGIDPDDVIMSPERARERGLTSTVTFPTGNLAPEGSVVKSTAIDPSKVDSEGVFLHEGPARVFTSEESAIAAIKTTGENRVRAGDIMVLIGIGPMGCGMPETFQLTSSLRYLSFGKHVTLLTDGRFSGVSTGACIGHVSPEALAGGPIAKVTDGDRIRVRIDCRNLTGTLDYLAPGEATPGLRAERILSERQPLPDLRQHPLLPDDTRLWSVLQNASGGSWRGCVFDVDRIDQLIQLGLEAEKTKQCTGLNESLRV